jgi:hypothetical protein
MSVSAAGPVWKTVVVEKSAREGGLLVDAKTGNEKWMYLQDCRTGDLYWHQTQDLVRTKCWAVLAAAPFYTLGVMQWYFRRVFIDIIRIGFQTIRDLGKHWDEKGAFLRMKGRELCTAVQNNVSHLFAAPRHMIHVMSGAAFGLIDPYEGLRMVALAEKEWRRNVPIKEDYRNTCHKDGCIKGIFSANAFYLAYCFQPRRHISDPLIRVVDP